MDRLMVQRPKEKRIGMQIGKLMDSQVAYRRSKRTTAHHFTQKIARRIINSFFRFQVLSKLKDATTRGHFGDDLDTLGNPAVVKNHIETLKDQVGKEIAI
jgi:hypothetical protein